MKNQYGFRSFYIIIFVITLAMSAAQVNASVKTDHYRNAIVQKLTQQLRTDLSVKNIQVKLNDIRDSEISNSRINFNGKALAVVINDKTSLPFEFSAQVNSRSQNIEGVTYQFVNENTDFAPVAAEDMLMKQIMTQISKDYKTTNIVISIDGFDASQLNSNQTKYNGYGEVRIGEQWKKINFNVVLDSQNQTADKISYEVQK